MSRQTFAGFQHKEKDEPFHVEEEFQSLMDETAGFEEDSSIGSRPSIPTSSRQLRAKKRQSRLTGWTVLVLLSLLGFALFFWSEGSKNPMSNANTKDNKTPMNDGMDSWGVASEHKTPIENKNQNKGTMSKTVRSNPIMKNDKTKVKVTSAETQPASTPEDTGTLNKANTSNKTDTLNESDKDEEDNVPDESKPSDKANIPDETDTPDKTNTPETPSASSSSSSSSNGVIIQHPHAVADRYIPRGKILDASARKSLAKDWGDWSFVDPEADSRPSDDFYAAYPNRDVPFAEFPENAWQKDPSYLSAFLEEGRSLVERAMEAILSEYGHGSLDEPDLTREERSTMFRPVFSSNYDFKNNNRGGYLSEKSFGGLVRRVLHSVMTEDTFVLVMGGHSAAAGHGNLFQQSYTLQFQKVMEPVFARLGVQCSARNIGMGGLGTSQNGLAAGSIYGPDMDILHWDSGMTEREQPIIDLFFRQGLIGGDKVPFLWSAKPDRLSVLETALDADVGMLGTGTSGIPETKDAVMVEELPWATQWVNCNKGLYQECRAKEYMGECWIDRPDFTPMTQQKDKTPSRVKWHPGNRKHQLTGRVMAFNVLMALDKALSMWQEADNFELPDEVWHVTEYYESIRQKAMTWSDRDEAGKDCFGMDLPDRVCTVPMKGRTEFTPRYSPRTTSIRSIMKYESQKPQPELNVYDPPDVFDPNLNVPDGAVDYLSIVENGNDFLPLRARASNGVEERSLVSHQRDLLKSDFELGKGWGLVTKSSPDNCDGSYDSFCGREKDSDCLLYAHNDRRGGLVFDSLSGWLVLNLESLTHGLIILKIEDWHKSGDNPVTQGWNCENNACPQSLRSLSTVEEVSHVISVPDVESNWTAADIRRQLNAPPICNNFQFEYSIDGEMKSWNATEWRDNQIHLQRVVQLWTILDDESFTDKPRDVEVAIRITGCQRINTLMLTHVYWA